MALATSVEFCRATRWLAFLSLPVGKAHSLFWEPSPLSPLWPLRSSFCFNVALQLPAKESLSTFAISRHEARFRFDLGAGNFTLRNSARLTVIGFLLRGWR
jgi:hypothetical protein